MLVVLVVLRALDPSLTLFSAIAHPVLIEFLHRDLFGELLEDTKEAVGDRAAVALRLAVDENRGEHGITWQEEGQAVVEMFSDLPDLWDVNISDWAYDSATARFTDEAYQ